ncbi:MAG: tyrosine-type recombinase/integrase [Paludibacteraceae bacterium]|nr:tyrosine-type recombinase/integrase [Paludibacteraceae bacterium]
MDGVKENLSYHDNRLTFGTLMLSAGIPIESISKMMGHTNIRTTLLSQLTSAKL